MIELKIASRKQVEYACRNFHYAKSVPIFSIAFSVFQNNDWCGCVVYGFGANNNMAKEFGLPFGKVFEFQRMALNGKQSCTSKILALSIKLIKKNCKNVELLVSYADSEQGHTGIIYQATNWLCTGISGWNKKYYIDGIELHAKSIYSKYKCNGVQELKSKGVNIVVVNALPKHKYIYPLNDRIKQQVLPLAKEYPKPAVKAFTDDAPAHQLEKAVVTDLTALIL
jgi:hypothetical protein